MFKLQSCDVLLFSQEGSGIKKIIGRWGVGKWGHVAMVGNTDNVPILFESTGRGAVIHSLESNRGRYVKVMRLNVNIIYKVLLSTALNIVADPHSYYDYYCIVRSRIPRVLKTKFPWLPIPLKYHRDAAMICSELVAEIFWRASINILPKNIVPLPGDFEFSQFLKPVAEGRLLVDIVV